MSLDRLSLARRRHAEHQAQRGRAQLALAEADSAVHQQEQVLVHAEKRLEKLRDILSERKREAMLESQKREWQVLDEQILATLGRRT
jgi:hypothetical protein